MTQQIINIGTGPSTGDGDPLRTAFSEINSNFTELYGTINGQAVTFSNVSGVTTSLGSGATFDVVRYVNNYAPVINRSGSGYSVGNVITIYGNLIGGAYSTQDLTITVATLGNATLGNIATVTFSGIPAQPVTSVAGRTGNVILTINDIVGLTAAYASQANIITANTLMKGYVDGQILAANAGVTAANLGMKGYVDQGNTIQSSAIIAANLGMKGYVDSVATLSSYSNVNVKAYTETMGFQNFSNVNVAAYLAVQGITGGSYSNVNATSLITSLGLSNYSNVNVKAYTESMGFQNYGNVNVAAYVTTANSAIIGYIDLANTIQSAQVNAANLAIVAANLGMKGYVDSVASQSIYGNINVKAYAESMGYQNYGNVNVAAYVTSANSAIIGYIDQANTIQSQQISAANIGVIGYIDQANTIQSQQISAANIGVIGYIDQANTIQSGQVGAANLAIIAANLGMKGYVDSVASQSIYGNINVQAYTESMGFANYGNVNVAAYVTTANSAIIGYIDLANTIQSAQIGAANLAIIAANLGMKGYVDSVASQSIYGNGNVKSYLTQFDGNIVPSANVTYSLGSITNQWKDLFVSNTTIYLGGTPVSITNGSLTVNGNAVGGTNLVTYSGNVGASSITLDGATGPIGNVKVLNGGNGFTMFGFFAGSGGSGSGLSVVPQGSSLFDPVQFNTRGTNYRVGDVITIVNTNVGNGYSNASVVVTSLQDQPAPSIFVGNSAYKFGADGNIVLPAGGGILDSTGASVLGSGYSNVGVATYLPTYSGNIANVRLDVSGILTFADGTTQTTAASGGGSSYGNANVTAYTESMGFQNFGNANVAAYLNTTGYNLYSNTNVIAYLNATGYNLYSNVNVAAYLTTYSGNIANVRLGTSGVLTFADGTTQTTASTGGGSSYGNTNVAAYLNTTGYNLYSNVNVIAYLNATGYNLYSNVNVIAYLNATGYNLYSNANVASYLPTYSGNIANVRIGSSGVLTFADGTTMTTASAGGGSSYGNSNVAAYLNTQGYNLYSNVNVAAYTQTMGFQNFGNVNVAAYVTSMGVTNYSNVNVAAYLAANITLNKLLYSGLTTVNTLETLIDSVIATGNTAINWTLTSNDNINNNFKSSILNSVNDGANVYYNEYAVILSNSQSTVATFTSNITGGNVNLYANGISSNVTIAFQRNLLGSSTVTGYIASGPTGPQGNAGPTNYSNVNVKAYTETMGFQNYSNVNVIAYLAGNITVGNIAGSVNGFSIGYRDVPQITVANLTLIASDAGKHYYGANTNPTTITIPLNSSVAFGNGTAISIVNQGTGNITVANAAGVQLYLAGNNTAGSRTLTSYGMATLIKVQVNTWFINGTGVV